MAFTQILYCPDDDLVFIVDGQERIRTHCSTYPNNDPNRTPQIVDVETYCGVEDCSAVTGGDNGGGAINQETFEAFYPWALLMLVTAFGIKVIRRTISSRV